MYYKLEYEYSNFNGKTVIRKPFKKYDTRRECDRALSDLLSDLTDSGYENVSGSIVEVEDV